MSKLNRKDILSAIDYADENGVFAKLNSIYEEVPSGRCSGCGKCCMESVGISMTEFLNIYKRLEESEKIRREVTPKIIDYYFLEFVKKNSCPFKRDDNTCSIYEVRPLNCRIYGNWKKIDYEANLKNILKRNEKFELELFDECKIMVNKEVSDFKIEYCNDFVPGAGYMSKEDRLALSDKVITLDSRILNSGTIDIEFKDRGIVEYFIESMIDIDMAFRIKTRVTKDEGDRKNAIPRLKKILLNVDSTIVSE
ncbi:MAG: YkgJ family cysteine cluster protein [Clostridioides sp.]|nr:YkgJ family cysteine cluster protein [Clostridioides sp.]